MSGVILAASWCNRSTKCAYCEEEIGIAAPMLIKKVWSSQQKRQFRFPYHFLCWIEEALTYLQSHPYEAAADRKALDLTDEQKEQRRKLLARRASIRQRIRNLGDNAEKIKILVGKEIEIARQIQLVGGVPDSWDIPDEALAD